MSGSAWAKAPNTVDCWRMQLSVRMPTAAGKRGLSSEPSGRMLETGRSSPLLPNGIYDSYGTPVTPSSLYLQQLCERREPDAVAKIGYGGTCAPGSAR